MVTSVTGLVLDGVSAPVVGADDHVNVLRAVLAPPPADATAGHVATLRAVVDTPGVTADALAGLIRERGDELLRAVCQRGGLDPESARDGIQSACELALRRLDRLVPGRLFGWLRIAAVRLANREARTHDRAMARARKLAEVAPRRDTDLVETDHRPDVLDAALAALQPAERALVLDVAGPPEDGLDALAGRLGCSAQDLRRSVGAILTELGRALGATDRELSRATDRLLGRTRVQPGEQHGLLKLIGPAPRTGRWFAECGCGRIVEVVPHNVRTARVRSCGRAECRARLGPPVGRRNRPRPRRFVRCVYGRPGHLGNGDPSPHPGREPDPPAQQCCAPSPRELVPPDPRTA